MFWPETTHVTGTRPPIKPAQTTEQQFFQSGNKNTGGKATILDDEWLNMVTDELLAIVKDAKITPKKTSNAQVLEAIKKLIANHVSTSLGDVMDQIMTQVDDAINQATGSMANSLVYPAAFYDFMEQSSPAGWRARNGQLISNASQIVPELYAALQLPENTWRLLDETTWQAQRNAAPWNGVGGVSKFVLNLATNTIRLPDTRKSHKEDSSSSLAVGASIKDTIRNITGQAMACNGNQLDWLRTRRGAFGPVIETFIANASFDHDGATYADPFSADSVVPTGEVNRPQSFGVLGCVYVGLPAS
jgi:hypothetical protein